MLLLLLLRRFSHGRLCATPQTAAHQAPPSLGSNYEQLSGRNLTQYTELGSILAIHKKLNQLF